MKIYRDIIVIIGILIVITCYFIKGFDKGGGSIVRRLIDGGKVVMIIS